MLPILMGMTSVHGVNIKNNETLISELNVSWYAPTIEDYKHLQNYLHNYYEENFNEFLHIFGVKRFSVLRFFKFISDQKAPIFEILPLNTDLEDKQNCVVCYASYENEVVNYKAGLERLLNLLKEHNFKGHFIYRIGGWPNVGKGTLFYFDVPYAFKPFFLDEIRSLGYKNVLFLDASICPERSLDPLFDIIEKEGFVFQTDTQPLSKFVNSYVIEGMGLTSFEEQNFQRYAAGIIGLNFEKEIVHRFLDLWLEAIQAKKPFYNRQPEETPMSIILNRLGIANCDYTQQLLLGDERFFTIQRMPLEEPLRTLKRKK